MSGGGSDTQTTVQSADPWAGVQPHLLGAFNQAAQLYGQGPPAYYPGSTVAPQSPFTQFGDIYSALQAGTNVMDAGNAMAQGASSLLGADPYSSVAMSGIQHLYNAADPASNQYFQSALEASMRPVTQQLQEQIMPGLRSGATGAGQYGSSRQGIAEGLASSRAVQTMADMAAQMGSTAYGQGLGAVAQGAGLGLQAENAARQAIAQGLALSPAAAQMQMMPGDIFRQIGARQEGRSQAEIEADMARYNYGQQAPFQYINDYVRLLSGAPGGQTSTQTPIYSNPVGSALGGAAAGSAIGGAMGYPGWGGIAGGLLGLFM